MKNWKDITFPAALVALIMVLVPWADHWLTGGFGTVTYVVEAVCALAVVGLVIAGIYNSVQDGRGK